MDTKRNHSDAIISTLGDIDPKDLVLTNAGFGLRASGTVVEENGIKHIKNVQMFGISLIASENIVDEQTRIRPESVQELNAPFYDPHQNLNLENDKPPRGYCGGAIQILDDFAFWKFSEITPEQLRIKCDALGISPELMSGDQYSTAKAMEDMRKEEAQANASQFELSEETIVRCGAVIHQYMNQPHTNVYHTEPTQEEAAQMIDALEKKGVSTPRRDMFHALFPIQPLGAETAKFKKREFDYELIGGL